MNQPEILLADEPTGNLDRKTGDGIIDLLKGLNERDGQTIVIVTHDTSTAEEANRVINMIDGRVVTSTE
ncbi:Macrolide export ATP-binding/permease protein MacB [subsurface metagenome]